MDINDSSGYRQCSSVVCLLHMMKGSYKLVGQGVKNASPAFSVSSAEVVPRAAGEDMTL